MLGMYLEGLFARSIQWCNSHPSPSNGWLAMAEASLVTKFSPQPDLNLGGRLGHHWDGEDEHFLRSEVT
jgi:hypothetical protein